MQNQQKTSTQKKLFINKETLKHLRPDSTRIRKTQLGCTSCNNCYGTNHGTRF